MNLISHVFAFVGIMTAGVIYGTDVLGALVMRPTWQRVDDRTLVAVAGHSHYYGDRRFPVPGALSVIATALTAVTAALSTRWLATAVALAATIALVTWLVIYRTVNAPINQELTRAAQEGRVPDNARALQTRWDSVITMRAVLQGVAVAALAVTLTLP